MQNPNPIVAWFQSHTLASHITIASILTLFGTLATLYAQVPQFALLVHRITAALPTSLEEVIAAIAAVILYYAKTTKGGSQ